MAREKRTGPPKPDTSDLPTLTEKQMRFVEGIVSGLTGSEAYRQAYDAEGMSDASVAAESARLRRHSGVDAWVRAFHIAGLGTAVLTKEQHIRDLAAIRERAFEQGDLKSAVAAEHLRGKASGFYVERSEHLVHNPLETLARIYAISPQMAREFAVIYGLTVPAAMPAALPLVTPDPPAD